MNNKQAFSDILQYVFDNEMEDFAENPSKDHVYYKAIVVESGVRHANEVLDESLRDLKGLRE